MRNIDDDHSDSYMEFGSESEFGPSGDDYYFDDGFDDLYDDICLGYQDVNKITGPVPTDKIIKGESKKVKVLRSEIPLFANRKVGKEVLRGFRRTDKNEAIRFATEEFIESSAFANVGKGVVSLRMKQYYNSLKSKVS